MGRFPVVGRGVAVSQLGVSRTARCLVAFIQRAVAVLPDVSDRSWSVGGSGRTDSQDLQTQSDTLSHPHSRSERRLAVAVADARPRTADAFAGRHGFSL